MSYLSVVCLYGSRTRSHQSLGLGMGMPIGMDMDIKRWLQRGRAAKVQTEQAGRAAQTACVPFPSVGIGSLLCIPFSFFLNNKKPACRGLSLFSSLFFVAAIRGK